MKTYIRLIAVFFLAALGFSPPLMAAQDVTNTKHNLASNQPTAGNIRTTSTEPYVCAFCHSPHTEANGPAPLWNRGDDATGYTMYSSSTFDMGAGVTAPAGISLACLSCHDGVTAFDTLINGSGSGNYVVAGASQGWAFSDGTGAVPNTMQSTSSAYIGKNLTGDHPISITYDPTADAQNGFNTLASVQAATNVQLYGAGNDQVECATCHDPHEADNPTFLRVASTAVGTLCTTCHIK